MTVQGFPAHQEGTGLFYQHSAHIRACTLGMLAEGSTDGV